MPPPIALQLYTLREQLAENYEPVVRQVADMGYAGVELAGMYNGTPEQAAKFIHDLGLQISSAHLPLPVGENAQKSIEVGKALGIKRAVCAWLPPERWATVDDIRATCAEMNQAQELYRANGMELHYHNHSQECRLVGDKYIYQHMLDYLDPGVGFEVDVYWAQTAGVDAAAMVREIGKRAPLLHIKDGPATLDDPMTAVGEGSVDFHAIQQASDGNADWWIVELDRCATDMLEAVKKSYAYLTQNGFAHGR